MPTRDLGLSERKRLKKPVLFRGEQIQHSDACEWSGKKRTRYTQYRGACRACDIMRGQVLSDPNNMPINCFGMKKEDRDRIYCMSAALPYAKCTKYTNPACACGKLIYNQTGDL